MKVKNRDGKEMGKINTDRYLRYVDLYNKLKENWEKKYD